MTDSNILTSGWLTDVVAAAQTDAAFRRASRALTTTLCLRDEGPGTSIRFVQGKVVQISHGRDPATDIELAGTRAQWERALAAAVDLDAAADPATGGLTISGDHVHRAGNALALKRLWLAMRRASGAAVESPRPDAEEPALYREIIGRYVSVSGYRTYYESVGTGRPIVCVHTGGADGREYRHVLPHLAALGYEGIALDMPGHGKSYPDLDSLTVLETAEEWIEFVLEFSRRLGLERPVYVGCAMSGSLLLHLAAKCPDAAGAIISVNGNVDYADALGEEFLDVVNHPQVNVADYFEALTMRLIGRQLPRRVENECLWHNARNLTPEVMCADLTIYNAHDIKGLLDRIRVPVLHLRGEFDPSVNAESLAAIAASIPQARIITIPGTGHIPMLEDPAAFNRELGNFLHETAVN